MAHDAIVFIGRMRPFTKAHFTIVRKALEKSPKVIVLVGSSFAARSSRNPWTFDEVREMISNCFDEGQNARLVIKPVVDYTYSDALWQRRVQEIVEAETDYSNDIGLIGHSKDETSYYLSMFPNWDSVNVGNIEGINATDIRRIFFQDAAWQDSAVGLLPAGVINWLESWKNDNSDIFNDLKEEALSNQEYPSKWGHGPHMTADSVVMQSGHVLLIRRGHHPFKGKWALPGGFINNSETLVNAAIRELREETGIDMPAGAIASGLKSTMILDDPQRDPRARIISQAHLFDLTFDVARRMARKEKGNPGLTKIKSGKLVVKDDDPEAEVFEVKWFPLADINREMMAFDHYHVITKMVSQM